jgi:hypothetical protein
MADITNPTVVRFCNERLRPAADRLAQSYYFACEVLDAWNALGGEVGVPADASVIIDGSAIDGRPVITGAKVHAMIDAVSALRTDYEAASKAKLGTILNVAVNTR